MHQEKRFALLELASLLMSCPCVTKMFCARKFLNIAAMACSFSGAMLALSRLVKYKRGKDECSLHGKDVLSTEVADGSKPCCLITHLDRNNPGDLCVPHLES